MNYKKHYEITLKRAKEISKIKLGRLPRCGYYVDVYRRLKSIYTKPSNLYPAGKMIVYETIQLVNWGGKLELTSYVSTYNQRIRDYAIGDLI